MTDKEIKKIVYTCVVADLFHHGHLKALKFAKSLGDYLICGVLTDEAVQSYRRKSITSFDERKIVIEGLNFVDRVIKEDSIDATNNLKKIHEEFKDSKLIFVRLGDKWKSFPEYEYLNSIGGELIRYTQPNYISDYKILQNLLKSYKGKFKDFEEFVNYFKVKDLVYYNAKNIKNAVMSTKADTLRSLNPLLKHSSIEKPFVFNLKDWKEKKEEILQNINKEFSPKLIVIRSSTFNEDTYESSMAGYFDTELNVPSNDLKKIENSINKVIISYQNKDSLNDLNQILVQPQTTEIKVSGVVFTETLETGAPYYTINYDDSTAYSDRVTKGLEYRTINIHKHSNPKNYPNEFYKLINAVQEIEKLVPDTPLDIEFAINKNNEVIIFQVRPLLIKSKIDNVHDEDLNETIKNFKENFRELSKRKSHLSCSYTYFADMPDWNPAEVIGDRPNYLDYSLYNYVITDSIWHKARTSQGYYNVDPAKLVILFGNKPYVDVRNTFNSFTPASISKELREKLVNFYMNKLKNYPELQDKVEFEILYTCYDLMFDDKSKELLKNGFNEKEIIELKNSLIELTNNLILNSEKSIKNDLEDNNKMESFRKEKESFLKNNQKNPRVLINMALELIDDCKNNGTLQFSRLARLAFIGKIILKSLVKKGIIVQDDYDLFLKSISTVATSINLDFMLFLQDKLTHKEFLDKYGHLRPGTYDITSMRYDSNPKILEKKPEVFSQSTDKRDFVLDDHLKEEITKELQRAGLEFDASYLLDFTKKSIESRELSKFEFTKSLSYAIELIAEAGNLLGFSREDISKLDLELLYKINEYGIKIKDIWKDIIESRNKKKSLYRNLILPPIIFSEDYFEIIQSYFSKPNFITTKKLNAEIINLNSINKEDLPDLKDKIVLLESGDPGYDWIFTKNIAGLITKYGGVASHMSIRCAEFGLPAAIGCGEIFDTIKNESHVFLDCETGKIVPFRNNII